MAAAFAALAFGLAFASAGAAQPLAPGRPQSSPVRAGSNFDPALRCMDDLLSRTSVGAGIYLVPAPLDDPGGKMGVTRDMIISAASRMSEKSRFFSIATDTRSLDGAVWFTTLGSVTSLDQQVESSGKGGGASIGNVFSGNVSKRSGASNLTVSLAFTDGKGLVVPGTFHSEQITLRTKGKAGYLGGSIGTVGGSLDFESSVDEGPQAAVRALIDLAMIEAVGALTQTPYADCLAKVAVDPLDREQAFAAFNRLKPAEQRAAVVQGLAQRGLVAATADDAELRLAIATFERAQGLPPSSKPGFEVYYALRQAQAAPAATLAKRVGRGPAVRVSPSGAGFTYDQTSDYPVARVGNKLAFEVTVVEPSYVACYYTDAASTVTRVFPSARRPAYRLAAGEILRIPSDQDGFIIRPAAGDKGEWLTCLAAPDNFLPRIEGFVPDRAMEALPFKSATALVAAAERADPGLSIDTLTYYVAN
ncbi:DUF4384 domain-containing protein [Caulobacter endophyticus]|nr:DUF4384 domain-containing protein [Caulobacter endophyticus]